MIGLEIGAFTKMNQARNSGSYLFSYLCIHYYFNVNQTFWNMGFFFAHKESKICCTDYLARLKVGKSSTYVESVSLSFLRPGMAKVFLFLGLAPLNRQYVLKHHQLASKKN